MALRGNLRDFTVTQLLNLINLAKKTGTLVIEGPGETASVSFREGKLAYAQIGQEDSRLAAVLYKANRITAGQYKALQLRNMGSDKELGLLLINAGYLSQDEILGSLQSHFTEVVRRLFTWVEGFFRFDNDALPPADRISIRLDLENLIIEGSRQLREWEQLQDEIPSLDMALKFTDRPGTNIRNVNLSVEEWRVVSYVNPRNSIRQIAAVTKLSEMEIRRIVYGLIQAGLVEVIRPEGAPLPRRASSPKGEAARPAATPNTEEQKSLVNRLITRIRAL
jgi:DNA-binding MarR family transcriptional regulator